MASYDEALKVWGAKRLAGAWSFSFEDILVETVSVDMEFDRGYQCCGGRDPECYCSLAESPSADVKITARARDGIDGLTVNIETRISTDDFNFADVLREIVEAGDGIVSL